MSKARPRTGLAKPREVERELLDAGFREKRRLRKLPPTDPAEIEWVAEFERGLAWFAAQNATARQLVLLWETTGSDVFRDAWREMRRLGLLGADIDERLTAMSGGNELDLLLVEAVERTMRQEGCGQQRAMEIVAARSAWRASTLKGAVQSIKRAKGRVAKVQAQADGKD